MMEALDLHRIPQELRDRPQWVGWRLEQRDGKDTKVPYRFDGSRASSTDPSTWGTFDEVVSAASSGVFRGIGYVFDRNDPFTGVDLDKVRDPKTETLAPDAQTIVTRLSSYAEVSQSGTGVHVIVRGRKPGDRARTGHVEIYDGGRYFVMTGDHIAGTPETIEDGQAALDAIYEELFAREKPAPAPAADRRVATASDSDLPSRMFDAKNGAAIERLWNGDVSAYGSASEADAALCAHLAFWTDRDAARIDSLFRRSGLYREKWDSRRGSTSYGAQTIANALAVTTEGYSAVRRGDAGGGGSPSGSIVSAAPRDGVVAERIRLPFATARELAARTPEIPDWVVFGYLCRGAVTELAGKVKWAGKTTFLLEAVRCVLQGRPFAGRPTKKSAVVYLTEQADASFREALERADLLDADDLTVLSWHDAAGVKWPEIVDQAVAECVLRGAGVLVVDTLGQWAGIRGDAENNAGDALEASGPLQKAAAAGIAVWTSRHTRKGGGEIGEDGRGSSAFAGAVDILLSLRRPEGGADPTVRVLHGLGRFTATPESLAMQLTPDGYVALGSEAALAIEAAKRQVLDVAPREAAAAKTMNELIKDAALRRTTAQEAIAALADVGSLLRVGEGKRNSPFRFWAPEMLSAATASVGAAQTMPSSEKVVPAREPESEAEAEEAF